MGIRLHLEGFPVRQILIMSLIRLAEPISFTSLFPYVYFMIRDFKVAPTEEDIPKYSGYLAASFAFFQFLFAVKWGKLSDIYGRKAILLIGLTGTAGTMLIFGFAPNFWVALFARSFAGCLNGNIAVLRTLVGEIATENRHQALAFLVLPLVWNVGSIIGPMIGGSTYLTKPSEKSPYSSSGESQYGVLAGVHESFISKHPYALSNVVIALIVAFTVLCAFLFLEETHPQLKRKRDRGLELGDKLLKYVGISSPERSWRVTVSEEARLLEAEEAAKPISYSGAFTPQVVIVMFSNFVVSLHGVVYSEFLPVFLALAFQPDKLKFPWRIAGGLGWDLSQIGMLISTTGFMGMLIILFIFPWMDAKFGTITGYRISVAIFPLVYFFTPWLVFTLHDYNPAFPLWLTPVILYLLNSLKTLGTATGLSQIMILTHRSALPEHRAYVNSTSMSVLALARFCGPVVFGYLMTLSEVHEIGWLIWWIMTAIAIAGLIPSFYIETS